MTRPVAPVQLRPTRAVHLLALVTIIAMLMLVASLLLTMRRQELQRAHRETSSLVRMLAEQTEQAFRGADLALKSVQDRMQSPYGNHLLLDSVPVRLLLGSRLSGLRQVRALFIVDAHGTIQSASAPDLAGTPWNVSSAVFKAASGASPSSLYISRPVQLGEQDTWTLYLARRLDAPDGSFRGVAVAAMNLKYFESYYAFMEQGFLQPVGLYHDDATLIASLPRRSAALGRPAAELHNVRLPTAGVLSIDVRSHGGANQGDDLVLARVPDFPLLVTVRENSSEALAAWRHAAIPILIGTSLVCIFVIIAAALLAVELRRDGRLSSALREADDRYRLTFDSVKDAIVSVDKGHRIVMFNRAAERMFGLPVADAIGMPLEQLLPERHRAAHANHVLSFMDTSEASREMAMQMDIHGLRSDGSEFPIESAISRTLIDGKQQLTAVLRDVTERYRKDAELREMNTELRRLSTALLGVREEERKRLSRELHDDLGQQLTGMKLELTWLGGRIREGRGAGTDLIDSMRAMLDRAIISVRHMCTELRPWILEERELGDALVWQVEEMSRRTNVRYACHLPAACLIHDEALATAVFRIAQEALSNVARHAEARKVSVQLVCDGDDLVLSVRDSGRGFIHDPGGNGIGLVSMRERATALGGRFRVISKPGRGTTIEVRIPLVNRVAVEEDA